MFFLKVFNKNSMKNDYEVVVDGRIRFLWRVIKIKKNYKDFLILELELESEKECLYLFKDKLLIKVNKYN